MLSWRESGERIGLPYVSRLWEGLMSEHSEDQIREYAHQLWEAAGQPEGQSDEFWHRAKSELESGANEKEVDDDYPKPMPEWARSAFHRVSVARRRKNSMVGGSENYDRFLATRYNASTAALTTVSYCVDQVADRVLRKIEDMTKTAPSRRWPLHLPAECCSCDGA
jgi:hypothetical protein